MPQRACDSAACLPGSAGTCGSSSSAGGRSAHDAEEVMEQADWAPALAP